MGYFRRPSELQDLRRDQVDPGHPCPVVRRPAGRRRFWRVSIEPRPLTAADAAAQCAGEDEFTVRWLTGGYGDVEGTTEYIEWLAGNAEARRGKRGFGVWMADRLCGYVDFDPDMVDGLGPDDVNVVNISYAVHPWARGQGVAAEAVRLVCDVIREELPGAGAAIRVEPENIRSVRVAQKSGFRHVREYLSQTGPQSNGSPVTMSLYLLDL